MSQEGASVVTIVCVRSGRWRCACGAPMQPDDDGVVYERCTGCAKKCDDSTISRRRPTIRSKL